MSDIASKKNQANESVLAADEKNGSYQLVRTTKENGASQVNCFNDRNMYAILNKWIDCTINRALLVQQNNRQVLNKMTRN